MLFLRVCLLLILLSAKKAKNRFNPPIIRKTEARDLLLTRIILYEIIFGNKLGNRQHKYRKAEIRAYKRFKGAKENFICPLIEKIPLKKPANTHLIILKKTNWLCSVAAKSRHIVEIRATPVNVLNAMWEKTFFIDLY